MKLCTALLLAVVVCALLETAYGVPGPCKTSKDRESDNGKDDGKYKKCDNDEGKSNNDDNGKDKNNDNDKGKDNNNDKDNGKDKDNDNDKDKGDRRR